MPIEHLKYESNGRKFNVTKDGKPTGQKVYKGGVGQVNILDHEEYKPYVWNSQNQICKFNKYEIRLVASGVEIYKDATKLLGLSVHPEIEKEIGEVKEFVRETATVSGITTNLITNEDSADRIEISYDIGTKDLASNITFEVGGARQIVFGCKLSAKTLNEKQRLTLEFDQKATLATSNIKLPRQKYEFAKSYWSWDVAENADHKVTLHDDRTEIHLKEKIYISSIAEKIKPDTWGPTTVSAADDGFEYDNTTWYDDDGSGWIAAGNSEDHVLDAGFMWTVTDSDLPGATINTGTKLNINITGVFGGGIDGLLTLADNRTPGTWGSANRPSQLTKHPDTVAWDEASSGSQDSPELNSFIQQRIDGNDSAAAFQSGDKMAIVWEDVNSPYNDRVYWAEGVGDLTIVFTPSSGSKVPIIMNTMNQFNGGGLQ